MRFFVLYTMIRTSDKALEIIDHDVEVKLGGVVEMQYGIGFDNGVRRSLDHGTGEAPGISHERNIALNPATAGGACVARRRPRREPRAGSPAGGVDAGGRRRGRAARSGAGRR
jgi:hypothetical protein